jgi:hypothetical protein
MSVMLAQDDRISNLIIRTKYRTFADIPNRELIFNRAEAIKLLNSLPVEIRTKFLKCFLDDNGLNNPILKDVLDYFLDNSEITRVVKKNPSSAETFEYLYRMKNALLPIDKYFPESRAGGQILKRLCSLLENIPFFINNALKSQPRKGRFLVVNLGSGPGHDMIHVLRANPDLVDKVYVRNIDIDKDMLNIGKELVNMYGLSNSFSFENCNFADAQIKNADLILLIGILCPLKARMCRFILKSLVKLCRNEVLVVFSTAQERMLTDDPLTDFIMRITGWNMDYKTDKDAEKIAERSGYKFISQFFDKPFRHHCMTVARLNPIDQ